MKFIRFILSGLMLVVVLLAVVAALAFVPTVQTWMAQLFLGQQHGLQSSLSSFSAGFGQVEVEDLHLEMNGATLTLPSFQAQFPILTALWGRKVLVHSLVAKGWTLDLSHASWPRDLSGPVVSAAEKEDSGHVPSQAEAVRDQITEQVLLGILKRWQLPFTVSLDGFDLEGDVVVPGLGKAPAKVHVVLSGGGVAARKPGSFDFNASSVLVDSSLQPYVATARGQIEVSMDSPRTFERIEIRTDLSVKGGSVPDDLTVSAGIRATRASGIETCTLDLKRGSRDLAVLSGEFVKAAHHVVGTWKMDLQDSDLAPFTLDRPLPSFAATGSGSFEADMAFDHVHVLGRVNGTAHHLGALSSPLERLGTMKIDTRFDLVRQGQFLRFDRLSLSLMGTRSIIDAHSLQPFTLHERTGALTVTDRRRDWIEGSARAIPLDSFPIPEGFSLSGGDVAGEFVVQVTEGGFVLHSKTPFTAAGVSVQRQGRILEQGLDLSLSILATHESPAWKLQAEPLVISSASKRWASVDMKASWLAGTDQPIALTGTWNADLDAWSRQLSPMGRRWMAGRSASGDFSVNLGSSVEADAKVSVIERQPGRAITASLHTEAYGDDAIAFSIPVQITYGSSRAQVSCAGIWRPADSQIEAKLTSESVTLDQLGFLIPPLGAMAGLAVLPGAIETEGFKTQTTGKDLVPFWGGWLGRLTIEFNQLGVGSHVLRNVRGRFKMEPGSLVLEDGHTELPHDSHMAMEGSVAFIAADELPYRLKATMALDKVEAATWFAQPLSGQDPVLEGRFSIAGTAQGKGKNLEDMAGRIEEEFHATSTAGIFRLLKTSMVGSIAQSSTSKASDTVSSVGSSLGSFLGIKRKSGSDGIRLSKKTEAVLELTNEIAEIGYDRFTFTASRGSDGTLHLTDIAITAPDEHLTGSGHVAWLKDQPVQAQPLQLEFQLGARGHIAELLSAAGLSSSRKDALGYTLLDQMIRFGGTVKDIDGSQWRELLAAAATQKPEGGN